MRIRRLKLWILVVVNLNLFVMLKMVNYEYLFPVVEQLHLRLGDQYN